MLVLDADALSLVQRGNEALLNMLDAAHDDVYVTVISLDEQLHGAFSEIASLDSKLRLRGYRRLRDIAEDYCGRPMLDYDEPAESIFQRLKRMKGRPATKDLRIASIVLSHDATLVTGNVKDFGKIRCSSSRPFQNRPCESSRLQRVTLPSTPAPPSPIAPRASLRNLFRNPGTGTGG